MKSREKAGKKASQVTGKTRISNETAPKATAPKEGPLPEEQAVNKVQTGQAEQSARSLGFSPMHEAQYTGGNDTQSSRMLVTKLTDRSIAFSRAQSQHADALYVFERTSVTDFKELSRRAEDLNSALSQLINARERLLSFHKFNA